MKRILVLVVLLVLVSGCAQVPKRHPLPRNLVHSARIPGIPKARQWGDQSPRYADKWFATPVAKLKEHFPAVYGQPHDYLAISGGGPNGAFGAGLLVGWTEAGDRPNFTIVTGVSTGALMAPFVFLGPSYDGQLEEMYTTHSTKDIIKKRGLLNTITSDAAADSTPLQALLAHYVDDRMLKNIADEHRKGRRLFIGTTNLDSKRSVIWDIGAIATSGDPNALNLIRQVLLASASIPIAFPPVLVNVEADQQYYDELHVDGGAASQVFLYPMNIDWDKVLHKLGVPGKPDVYVIRNSVMDPKYKATKNKIVPIAVSSMNSLIRSQGIGDLYQIYLATLRDGLDYHLAYIPDSFEETPTEQFDPVYMRKLFDLGKRMGRSGYPWDNAPPGYKK